MSSPPLPCPADASGRLLERSPHLALLEQAVRQVAEGGAATVVVHGRPGTGRTAVLAEAASLARGAGLHVVTPPARRTGPRRLRDIASHLSAQTAYGPAGTPLAVLVDDAEDVIRQEHDAGCAGRRPLLRVTAGTDPAVLGADGPPGYEVALRPLSADAVRVLLVEAYGEEAGGPLVPAATAATGGSPAVLCAALRWWPAPAPGADEFVALADQVGRRHVRRTLARVSGRTVALVEASAVADGDLPFDRVCELAGILPPWRERARAELAGTGLLDQVGHPRLYDPLVADRVLGLMDDGRRRDLYERAVRLGRGDGIPAPVLGRLVAHSRTAEPWAPAALYAAGVHARRSGDEADAVAFLEQALDRGASGELRAKVLLALSTARLSLRPEAADRGFRRVLTETSGPDGAAVRLLAADLLLLRGGGSSVATALDSAAARRTTSAAEQRTLLGLRELALERGPAEASTVPDHGDEASRPALDAAEAAAAAWRHCLAGREIDRARRLAIAALERAEAGLFAPRLVAARVLAVTEDVALARVGLRRIEAEARRQAVGPAIGQALLGLAELALRTDDPDEAGARLAEALAEVPRTHWHPRSLPRLAATEALVALGDGRPDLAESALVGALPDRHEHGVGESQLLFAGGLLGLHTGRAAEAVSHLRECGRILLALGCPNPAVVPWRPHLAMALASADPSAAARLAAESLAEARAWSAPGTVGSVHLWTGLTLTGLPALTHLRSAVRVLAGSSARRRYVRATAETSAALLDDGRPAEGRRLLDEAVAAERADGERPVPRVQEVVAMFAALPKLSRAQLSPAQLRVALLAAEGRSNKAIAEKLSVSLRTVELHLTSSYRTLGIAGRADLTEMLGHAASGRR
ncbi:LuxR C-terminal-related transcriptional regulator [Streptomyces sp. NPDC056352]|uniref:helix-turn-helix transcriptional regulator n=1 Tax=Streptomyces sp. NPDC056352 TaxID=3345791 RepID=UPI0035E19450